MNDNINAIREIVIFIASPTDQSVFNNNKLATMIDVTFSHNNNISVKTVISTTLNRFIEEIESLKSPSIIHIIAHSDSINLFFEKGSNTYETPTDPVKFSALKAYLEKSKFVKVVLFSSCSSDDFAKSISEVVEYSIGFKGFLRPEEDYDFYAQFYAYLNKHCSIVDSFKYSYEASIIHKLTKPDYSSNKDNKFVLYINTTPNKSDIKRHLEENYSSNPELYLEVKWECDQSKENDFPKRIPYLPFGNLILEFCPVEGNALYPLSEIKTELDNRFINLPEDLNKYSSNFRDTKEDWVKNHKKNEDDLIFWNGKRFSLYEYYQTRYDKDEKIRLILKFKKTDYANFLSLTKELDTLNMVLDINGNPTTFREKYFPAFDIETPNPYFTHSFGVNLLVITNDNKAIFTKRSGKVANKGNLFHISMNEGMDEQDLINGKPSVYKAAFRGLDEELGLPREMKNYDLKFITFGALPIENEYGLLGRIRVDFNSSTLNDYYIKKAKDRGLETTNELYFTDYSPKSIFEFILEHKPWVSHGLATIYYSLCYDFGHEEVDNELGMIQLDDDTVKRITFVSNSSL